VGSPDDDEATDYTNFVVFVGNVRDAFTMHNGGWQITVSLPYKYDKLRSFSLKDLARQVDWFNVRAYDIYDLWKLDANDAGTVQGNSNITAISNTLDLLARNNIPANMTVLGLPFFGTSYTLTQSTCTQPGCHFDGPGFPQACTDEYGFMNYGGRTPDF
jgi:chitinase